MDEVSNNICILCRKSNNLKQCSRCKKVYYCGRDHQIKHWPVHKKTCSSQIEHSAKNDSAVEDKHILRDSLKTEKSDTSIANKEDDNKNDAFDERPLLQMDFPKLPSFELPDVAKFAADNLNLNGYCVVDDLFDNSTVSGVVKEVKKLDDDGKMCPGQLGGGLTSGNDRQKNIDSSLRSDKLTWVNGNEDNIPHISKVAQTLDAVLTLLNGNLNDDNVHIGNRTKFMIACYPGSGTFYRRHVDNPNKDGRLITCILYLNLDWNVQNDGGLLRIFPADKDTYIDVAPIANRLLFFWSDRRNPHEVQPAYKTRYAMTAWYYDEFERKTARKNEIEQETMKVQEEIALLEVRTKEEETKNLKTKIESESMKAVAALSESEIQAIAAVISGNPDPSHLLSQLGISQAIQKPLLKVIKERNL